jgi:transposase-like protein
VRLTALFLDAVFLPVRPGGPKESVLVGSGFSEAGERVLLAVIKAVEQCWPASDRQQCAVHRLRNLLAKLPERDRTDPRCLLAGAR